jgi:hypothetical protein
LTAHIARLSEAEVRQICRERLEALEHWLRRLIDDTLSAKYGDYFSYADSSGNRIIKGSTAKDAIARRKREPQRYPRTIDALLLDEAIDLICKPQLFKDNFQAPLALAFPEGREEARTFLKRITSPRNNLAHANAIGLRQAEQIICYTNDVIDSLKTHYRQIGMEETYDVPLILKLTDSFGNSYSRSQFSLSPIGGILMSFKDSKEMYLRPGDILTLEIEVDPSYDTESYSIKWFSTKLWSDEPEVGHKTVVPITLHHVGEQFHIHCEITAHRDWHLLGAGTDDSLVVVYKVLPPVR